MGEMPVVPEPAALPWWWALLLPVLLGFVTWLVLVGDAALSGGRASLAAPVREVARLLVGQRRSTVASDTVLSRVGGGTLPGAALLAAAVLPLGERPVADLSVGVVWFNAMEVLAWAAVWMVGWGSNSALGLVGGYRFVAQGLAYELPHMFAIITAALGAESLRITAIVDAQRDLSFERFKRVRGWLARERLLSLMTVLLGPPSMAELGLPLRPPWVVGYLVPLNVLRYQVWGRLPGGQARLERWGVRTSERILSRHYGDHERKLGALR